MLDFFGELDRIIFRKIRRNCFSRFFAKKELVGFNDASSTVGFTFLVSPTELDLLSGLPDSKNEVAMFKKMTNSKKI